MFKKRAVLPILIFILLLITTLSLSSTAENLKLHFIDVGQGDSIFIEIPGNKKILVDGGDRADRIAAGIINYLKDQGVKKLDYIISTHPHADHIGGLEDIIDYFEVGTVLDSGKIHTSKTYENYLIKIDQKNINFDTPRQGDELEIGKSKITFLHPDQQIDNYDLNNSSLVFVLNFGDQNFLFTGDIEKKVESELLEENPDLKVNLIKVPHHGSKTSSLSDWLKNLSPEIAVIQVGADNHYGHPTAEVIELYQAQGAEIYRNDLNGNIVVTADGKNYAVKVDKTAEKIKNGTSKNAETKKPSSAVQNNQDLLININTAGSKILDQLWGIGPATANKIINYRQNNGHFKKIEEIKEVDGIDDYKFERWQDKITVGY